MRIAIVYDCLFPNTIGGAERWYRDLAERLAEDGHSITYLTRRQWGDEGPQAPFSTVAVAPGGALYTGSGRRRIWPPIRFGVGVFLHLLRHGRRYDVVHGASFPYFSLLGAALALRLRRSPARLIVDWWEAWRLEYWRSYLGPVGGRIGFAIQRLCTRLPELSFTFSQLVEDHLRELRHRAPIIRHTGFYAEPGGDAHRTTRPSTGDGREPLVLAVGRHIPEKRVTAIPPAIARAREQLPELRCLILGEGPETEATRVMVRELGLDDAVEVRGRVGPEEVERMMARASCLLHPSEREGYGLVVIEAVSLGTPAVVARGPENASTELIEPGVNGFVAASAEPGELADAVAQVIAGGSALRETTARWYEEHREGLSIEGSLARVEASYSSER